MSLLEASVKMFVIFQAFIKRVKNNLQNLKKLMVFTMQVKSYSFPHNNFKLNKERPAFSP
jgi:hypothetical protein